MTMKLDVTRHFDVFGRRGRTASNVTVSLMKEMYRPASVASHHWLHLTFRGFLRLRQVLDAKGQYPKTFCAIGSSSGLDAIGAWEALPVQALLITDVISTVLPVAKENIRANCLGLGADSLESEVGDLTEPLQRRGLKVDVLYENLPALPARMTESKLVRNGAAAASFYSEGRGTSRTPPFVRNNLLELHDAFLSRASACLSDQGCVVCAIGGRVEWAVIERMFRNRGFAPEVLAWTLKPQEQADKCLPRYAEREGGVRFTFYSFQRAAEELKARVISPEERSHLDWWNAPIDEAREWIMPFALCAQEAFRLYHGRPGPAKIGHLAYLVLGTPVGMEERA